MTTRAAATTRRALSDAAGDALRALVSLFRLVTSPDALLYAGIFTLALFGLALATL